MNIGETKKTGVAEPVTIPIPKKVPVEPPPPRKEPARPAKREKVPA